MVMSSITILIIYVGLELFVMFSERLKLTVDIMLKVFLMVSLLLATVFVTLIVSLQSNIQILETTPENVAALLMGLQYLINISYVDDTEVFKVVV